MYSLKDIKIIGYGEGGMDGEGQAIGCYIDLGYYINKEALGGGRPDLGSDSWLTL